MASALAMRLRIHFGPPVGPVGRYIRRPVTRSELDREVRRLDARRSQR
jgi:hypothetical protein